MKKLLIIILVVFTHTVSAQTKNLSVCTLEWPPYFSQKLPHQGLGWKIIQEAFKSKGYTLKIKFQPWSRAVLSVKNGTCDALAGAFYSKERATWSWFSAPFGEARSVLFKRKDQVIKFKSLQDLKPYKIGVGRGFFLSQEFDNADYLQKVGIKNADQGFKMIYLGRLDLVPFSHLPGKMMLNEIEATGKFPGISQKIVPILPPLKFSDIHITFSKKDPDALEKLRDFNSGLTKLYRSGRYNEILKEYGL